MGQEPARKDIFAGQNTNSVNDTKPMKDRWVNHKIAHGHMKFEQQMSRKEQTVAITHSGLKWMHLKSADEIARAK